MQYGCKFATVCDQKGCEGLAHARPIIHGRRHDFETGGAELHVEVGRKMCACAPTYSA